MFATSTRLGSKSSLAAGRSARRRGRLSRVRDRTSYVIRQNDITLVVTGALSPDSEIAEHVKAHGDGVHDIAFAVDDATSAWRETTSRGARSVREPLGLDGGEDGTLRVSSVGTY